MKILITSGGTKIPVDRVRNITNMSSGTFGSKIAIELLKMNQEVIFLKAKHSKFPFTADIDFYKSKGMVSNDFNDAINLYTKYNENYREYQYVTYDEYEHGLQFTINVEQPEIIVLAAAVSDYGVENYIDGKIRSKEDAMTIKLKVLPKLIGKVKEWAPTAKLVGFKLLVNSKYVDLIAAAKKSIVDNKCDMVVANDLQDIRDNNHKVYLVFPTVEEPTYYRSDAEPNDRSFLARKVAEHIINL